MDGAEIQSSAAWRWVEATVREVFARYDFREIRTPILEPTPLVARGVGQTTDIVSKEMFAFVRGDTDYVLRPEVTAPVMRAYLQHHLGQSGGAQRLYYIGPCFRAERPQKGRYRQFHQFGCELIGAPAAAADAEVIAVMMAVYAAFGIPETTLRLNTLGDGDSRARYREALRAYLEPYAADLSETSRARLQTNPLRILDTKNPEERRLLDGAPTLPAFVSPESRAHYAEVKALLAGIGVAFEEDPFLVRGLDYYTHTAFELESPNLGAQSALAGGGRYDLLAPEIGAKGAVPAVGFAAGMERLFLALGAAGCAMPAGDAPEVYVAALGPQGAQEGFRVAQRLRRAGLAATFDVLGRSLKAQLREANKLGARFTVVIGENELACGAATVKNMATGAEIPARLAELADVLKAAAAPEHVSPA